MKSLIMILFLSLGALADSIQFSPLGFTIHGYSPDQRSLDDMRNKITQDGRLAINPQLNFTFNKDSGEMYNTSLILDCNSKPSIVLAYGKKYAIDQKLYLGYVAGIFAKMYPPDDSFELGRVGNYQFIPLPGLYAEYKITERVSARLTANYLLNFIDLAWEF